jgi:hypothetical protein
MKRFVSIILLAAVTVSANPYIGALSGIVSSTPPATYLVQQNAEGAGYDNSETWTESGIGIDEDYTGVVLAGSQSLRINTSAAAGTTTSPAFADQADVWGYFLFHPVSLPAATTVMVNFITTIGNDCLRVRINAAGNLLVRAGGGTEATSVGAMSAGNTYHVWIHYVKGSGANAFASVAFSTDGTRPTSGNNYRESTNGTITSDAQNLRFGQTSSSTFNFVFDKVRVDEAAIGDNPL